MITVRRGSERVHDKGARQEKWLTFDRQDRADPWAGGFGILEILNEVRLAPGAGVPRNARQEAEILTYVHEGVLAYEDSIGHSGLVQAGEFQRVTSGHGLRHSKMNPSRSDWAHFYQIRLHPSEVELEPGHEQKRFCAAHRRNRLCVIASVDARRGSLRVHLDALLYSSLLDPGRHLVHELLEGRSAWLHLVRGEVTLGEMVLTAGDGAGVTAERAVSITASEESEILLVDIGEPLPRPSSNAGPP
jgi:quercetin 2,3-dioxygenase